MQDVTLPTLHDAANAASLGAQRRYLCLVRVNLAALTCGAIAGAIVLPAGLEGQGIAGVATLVLVVALVTTLIIQVKAYERTWYGGRAVAESVKTLAWRYMVRAEPFDEARSIEVDALFAGRLREILADSSTLNVHLRATAGEQITPAMRAVRAKSLAERRDFYSDHRIREQQDWYLGKAKKSQAAEKLLFASIWIINLLAVAAGILMIIHPTLMLNATGVLATVAASLFAWLQVRRHQELAQSYAVTAQELALALSTAENVSSEHAFAVFVADAEAAISREHILWVARRDAGIRITRP